MKMIFVVFSITSDDGKHLAMADTIKTGENLAAHINRYGAGICHLCENREQAENIATAWNRSYWENGTYYFNTPPA